jgi:hypothetical protein
MKGGSLPTSICARCAEAGIFGIVERTKQAPPMTGRRGVQVFRIDRVT